MSFRIWSSAGFAGAVSRRLRGRQAVALGIRVLAKLWDAGRCEKPARYTRLLLLAMESVPNGQIAT